MRMKFLVTTLCSESRECESLAFGQSVVRGGLANSFNYEFSFQFISFPLFFWNENVMRVKFLVTALCS